MESWDSTSKAVFMAKRALAPLGHIDQVGFAFFKFRSEVWR